MKMGDFMKHYDGTKLLSLMDINGKKPEIYLCTTNRSAGKTTWFSRYLVKKAREKHEKFCLVYRYKYELSDVPEKFFRDISSLFFPGCTMTSENRAKGCFTELYIDDEPVGYAVALNTADTLKKYSHLLSDVQRMFFDEFQSETNHYCPDEIKKLLSIHTSIARGQGKAVRYVPLYMCGNAVSILNPYYVELGISTKLQRNTKFMRGDGFVLESGFISEVADAQLNSGFNRAFAGNKYVAYSAQNIYLNDTKAFIDRPTTVGRYMCTLRYGGRDFGVRSHMSEGIIHCDGRPDATFPLKIVVDTADHDINYVMLKSNDTFLSTLRYYFEMGCFRFQDMACKEAVLKALSY